MEIMLGQKELEPDAPTGTVLSMSLYDPGRLDELYRRFHDCGAKIVSRPQEVTWQEGTLEFRVKDPDGNLLLFWGSGPGVH